MFEGLFGDFHYDDTVEPLWRTYLERASDSVIQETGLERDELKRVLEVCYKNRIIN